MQPSARLNTRDRLYHYTVSLYRQTHIFLHFYKQIDSFMFKPDISLLQFLEISNDLMYLLRTGSCPLS